MKLIQGEVKLVEKISALKLNTYAPAFHARQNAENEKYQKQLAENLFASLDNKSLKEIARASANSEVFNEDKKKNYAFAMLAVPATDIFINGTTAKSLGGKVLGAASKAGAWTGAFVTLGTYSALSNKLTDSIPALKKAQQEHPIASSILNMTGALATLVGVNSLYNFTKKNLANSYPKIAKNIRHLKVETGKAINKSFINKKIFAPTMQLSRNLLNKVPYSQQMVKYALPFVPVALALGLAGKIYNDKNNVEKLSNSYYNDLKAARNEIILQKAAGAQSNAEVLLSSLEETDKMYDQLDKELLSKNIETSKLDEPQILDDEDDLVQPEHND